MINLIGLQTSAVCGADYLTNHSAHSGHNNNTFGQVDNIGYSKMKDDRTAAEIAEELGIKFHDINLGKDAVSHGNSEAFYLINAANQTALFAHMAESLKILAENTEQLTLADVYEMPVEEPPVPADLFL